MSELIHTNDIAIAILKREYADYKQNSWHYDREYRMLVEAQNKLRSKANGADKKHRNSIT